MGERPDRLGSRDGLGRAVGPELARQAARHAGRTAIVDARGEHAYDDLLAASAAVADRLLAARRDAAREGVPGGDLDDAPGSGAGADLGPGDGLDGARVAFLAPPGLAWAAALLGIWRAGGVAVPLCAAHPPIELEYAIENSDAELVLAGTGFGGTLGGIAEVRGATLLEIDAVLDAGGPRAAPGAFPGDGADAARPALILYTSGTTGRPKGAVLTHRNLAAQVDSLVEAWGWTTADRLVHALPLHHTHGIVNGLLCALASGATCDMLARFEADGVWHALAERPATLFMGVPTMYRRLVDAWDAAAAAEREAMSAAAARLRLAVSGSAALPIPLFARWQEVSGSPLLERYGMTEIGMALSNPLDGERRPGTVGLPLPGVSVRLVDEAGRPVEKQGATGEIQVAGPTVFRQYWRRPEETAEAFDHYWFRTGDEGIVEDGYWRILGRRSVDIVKSGGEKVSALEVEGVLAGHPAIAECAVVGAPDPEWGERVCAAIVPAPGASIALAELRTWARERLAPWKIPTRLSVVADLPRNAMGKVVKPRVRELFESNEEVA